MLRHLMISTAVLGLALVGCDDPKPAQPPAPQAPAQTERPTLKDEVSQGVRQGAEEAKQLAEKAVAKGGELVQEAKPHVEAAAGEVKQAATQAKQVVGQQVQQLINSTSRTAATTQAASSTKELNDKIDLALRYTKERKLDLADKTLAQVEARSGELSGAGKARMETVRQMIDAAKQAQSFRSIAKPTTPQP